MKRFGMMLLTLAVLLSLSACSEKEEAFTPDYDSAIGVIFVNNSQLSQKRKRFMQTMRTTTILSIWMLPASTILMPAQRKHMPETRT